MLYLLVIGYYRNQVNLEFSFEPRSAFVFIKILSEGDFCDFFVVFSEQTEVSQIRQSVSAIALPNDFFVGCDFKDGNALSVMPVSCLLYTSYLLLKK